MEEFEGRRRGMLTTSGMVQPNQQHVVPRVKRVEWGLGTRVEIDLLIIPRNTIYRG